MAHIYHAHFLQLVQLDLHQHLNCVFSHMVIFGQEHKLLETTKDLNVLEDLIEAMQLNSRSSSNSSEGAVGGASSQNASPSK